MNKQEFVIFKSDETVAQSVFKDVVTFVTIAFCVYISQDSTWWTFLTGAMFIFMVVVKVSAILSKAKNTFRTKAELQEWVDSLEPPPTKVE